MATPLLIIANISCNSLKLIFILFPQFFMEIRWIEIIKYNFNFLPIFFALVLYLSVTCILAYTGQNYILALWSNCENRVWGVSKTNPDVTESVPQNKVAMLLSLLSVLRGPSMNEVMIQCRILDISERILLNKLALVFHRIIEDRMKDQSLKGEQSEIQQPVRTS